MKKLIGSLFLTAAALLPMSNTFADSWHGRDYGRLVGYTAAGVLTAGVISSLCCNRPNPYASSYNYDRGRYDEMRYQNSVREQEAYDRAMSARYYAPPPVVYTQPAYYAPPPPPAQVYYYQQPAPSQVIYYRAYP